MRPSTKTLKQHIRLKRQRGIATLVTAVVLMLAVFGITYYMSGAVISESRVVASQQRGSEAFNAAQAGIEAIKSNISIGSTVSNASSPWFVASASEESPGLVKIESVGFSEDGAVERVITYFVGKKPSDQDPPTVPIVAKGGVKATGNISAVNNYSNLTIWNGLESGIKGSASTYTSIDKIKNQLSTIKNTNGTATYGADVVLGDQNLKNADANDIVYEFFGYSDLTSFAESMGAVSDESDGRVSVTGSSGASKHYCYHENMQDCEDEAKLLSKEAVQVQSLGAIGNINLTSFGHLSSDSDWKYADWRSWEVDSGRSVENLDDAFSGSSYGITASGNTDDKSTTIEPDYDYIGTPSNPVMIVVDGEVSIPSHTYVFGVVVAQKIKMASNTQVFGGVVALSDDDDAFEGAGGSVVFMDEMLISNAGRKDEYIPIKSGWKDW